VRKKRIPLLDDDAGFQEPRQAEAGKSTTVRDSVKKTAVDVEKKIDSLEFDPKGAIGALHTGDILKECFGGYSQRLTDMILKLARDCVLLAYPKNHDDVEFMMRQSTHQDSRGRLPEASVYAHAMIIAAMCALPGFCRHLRKHTYDVDWFDSIVTSLSYYHMAFAMGLDIDKQQLKRSRGALPTWPTIVSFVFSMRAFILFGTRRFYTDAGRRLFQERAQSDVVVGRKQPSKRSKRKRSPNGISTPASSASEAAPSGAQQQQQAPPKPKPKIRILSVSTSSSSSEAQPQPPPPPL
jgi:hypothetical protein